MMTSGMARPACELKRGAVLRLPRDGVGRDDGGFLTSKHVLAQLGSRGLQAFQGGRLVEEIQNWQLRRWR